MPAYNSHTLQLYCDNTDVAWVSYRHAAKRGEHKLGEFPTDFYHYDQAVCRKLAKKAGWLFKRNGQTICPRCTNRAKPQTPSDDQDGT